MDNHSEHINYIYTYTCRKDERSLRDLEMRSFFGLDSETSILESSLKIAPSRSPFMKERIDVIYEGNRLNDIFEQVEGLELSGATFKVIFVKNETIAKVEFDQRRSIERKIGLIINGEADLFNPDMLFAIMNVNGRWVFGNYHETEAVWFRHQRKPNDYSVALNTRVARAVANIAVPDPVGIQAIDPCCGIGTVLVEALSMGIDIVGSDINPLILPGVRENIAHFGLEGEVALKDIRNVTNRYDVAIIDLPYNLCSVITPQDQLEMFQSARRFAKKLVVITVEPVDSILVHAGFEIVDRGLAKKARFTREVIVCV